MLPAAGAACPSTPEAEAFVRFCYQRRRVGWPELYDEMCAVAVRGLFRGMGHDALAEIGVGFSLFETPRLAQLVCRVVSEEQAARRAARAANLAAMEASSAASSGDGHGAAAHTSETAAGHETSRAVGEMPRGEDRASTGANITTGTNTGQSAGPGQSTSTGAVRLSLAASAA